MKKIVILLLIYCAFIVSASAQNLSTLSTITVRIANSGRIMYNNEVKGYYSLYLLDSTTKEPLKTYLFLIQDENLRKLDSIEIKQETNIKLQSIVFNGQAFGFLFSKFESSKTEYWNKYILLSYDRSLKQIGKIEKKERVYFDKVKLVPIPNKGFLLYSRITTNYTNQLHQQWEYNREYGWENTFVDSKFLGSLQVQGYENTTEKKDTSKFYRNTLIVQDITTGNMLASVPLWDQSYYMESIKVVYDSLNHSMDVFGSLYTKTALYAFSQNAGLFHLKIDISGKILRRDFNLWTTAFQGFFNEKSKTKQGINFCFHNILQTKDGTIFLIGEEHHKLFDRLVTYDIVIFELDSTFTLKEIHTFTKTQQREKATDGLTNSMRHKLQSLSSSKNGYFDYRFSQMTDKGNGFIAAFHDPIESKDKIQFMILVYTPEKNFSIDRITIGSSSGIKTFVEEAKSGYIKISQYDSKKKKLDMHLAKINI
ncbi:hypothetical protein QNI19_06695 [Cytophagaceae bacterium DM2B3-1]|uniref:Uncharacterized protein n=1 Tax=Xanthocytophaga flava TaxID=3048013 RepID=A0ABT7CFU8_9BACT|nr:DUF6770 family protein [Xanthocytophaga flavus]MDJ1492613.1 hypothetical protein [Xanthocytophaga flavus]